MSWLFVLLNQMFKAVKQILVVVEQNQVLLKQNADKLDRILLIVEPPQPVKFTVTFETGEKPMSVSKLGKLKITFRDDGTAKAQAQPVDKFNAATTLPDGTSVPAWVSSDPGLVVTPDTTDPTGLSAILSPATPPVLVTGASVSVSATLASGTVISGASDPADPINVIGSDAAGFKVTQAAA